MVEGGAFAGIFVSIFDPTQSNAVLRVSLEQHCYGFGSGAPWPLSGSSRGLSGVTPRKPETCLFLLPEREKAIAKRQERPRYGLFLDRQGEKVIASARRVHEHLVSGAPPFFCIFDPAQINTFQEANIVKIDSFLARELPGHFWGPLEASLG